MVDPVFKFSLLRRSEWICLAYFTYASVLAFFIKVPPRRRFRLLVINVEVAIAIFLLPGLADFTSKLFVSVVRDWLPAPLILLAYHEAGRLTVLRSDQIFEKTFLRWDEHLFRMGPFRFLEGRLPGWVDAVLEFAYLQCYLIVPSGIAVLYLAHRGRYADSYWSVVLAAAFAAHGVTPLFPAQPPRKLAQDFRLGSSLAPLRKLNLWVLDHASIKVNTFPSGHVASAIAASLALMRLLPIAGICYLAVAIGIALATVRGRYHYSIDAVLGSVVAVAAFLINVVF